MGATGSATISFNGNGLAFDRSFSTAFANPYVYDSCPTVDVIGQAAILAGSDVEAWIMGADSTADNSTEAHALAALIVQPTIVTVAAGVGFTIRAMSEGALLGTFKIRWVWN